jgi:Contractile injection system tube protein/LysM domain
MADPGQFVKAELEIEGKAPIPVYFNPTEYSISKSNEWKYDKVTGNSFPKAQFGGGNPRELTLNLMLDASLLGKDAHVRGTTNDLFKMMEVKEGQTAGSPGAVPPFVTFRWGKETTFKSVCTQLTVAYKLFRPNGDPIRAEVKMTLKQAETAGTASANGANRAGNPTTRANAGHGIHIVKDGDTLPSIAYSNYGDATVWRAIAEANGIENPLHLRRGRSLSLPKLAG